MFVQAVAAPRGEPLDRAQVKRHLRIADADTDHDAWIDENIARARAACAGVAPGRQLLHARYQAVLEAFANWWHHAGRRPQRHHHHQAITLPVAPVIGTPTIAYVDQNGTTQTLDQASYYTVATPDRCAIYPAYGTCWPYARCQANAVTVTFDAGYASPFTADADADTLTVRGPKVWAVDDVVRLSNAGGALPAGLAAATDYHVVSATSGVYQLSLTQGGSAVDITDAGTGTSFFGEVPPEAVSWMLLRLSTMFENRAGSDVVQRGESLQTLPFTDRLLDSLQVYA